MLSQIEAFHAHSPGSKCRGLYLHIEMMHDEGSVDFTFDPAERTQASKPSDIAAIHISAYWFKVRVNTTRMSVAYIS